MSKKGHPRRLTQSPHEISLIFQHKLRVMFLNDKVDECNYFGKKEDGNIKLLFEFSVTLVLSEKAMQISIDMNLS